MRLHTSNKSALKKVRETVEHMEEYKKKLQNFVMTIAGANLKTTSARPPSFLLTHFTNKKSMESIIRAGKIQLNNNGYVSLTELNPFEFHTITQSRRYGFAFLKDELMAAGIDLFSPLAFSTSQGCFKEIEPLLGDVLKQFVVERTSSQTGISFVNMLEIRSAQDIELDRCRLFLRNEPISEELKDILANQGIFQLPHYVSWYRDYFLRSQMWSWKETSGYIVFRDTRNDVISSDELIRRIRQKEEVQ